MTKVTTPEEWLDAMDRGVALGQRLFVDEQQRLALGHIAGTIEKIRRRHDSIQSNAERIAERERTRYDSRLRQAAAGGRRKQTK